MRISKSWILGLCAILLCFEALAQTEEADSLASEKSGVLTSTAVLFDYGKLIGLFIPTETKYEGGLQLDFWDKLIVVGEYGVATLEPNGAYINAGYVSEGSYYRAGIGYKVNMKPGNNLFISFRYAQSNFSDKGNVEVASATGIYDPLEEPFERKDEKATWYEVVLSSEKQMWKGLHLGFHVRLRVMGEYNQQAPLDIFAVPGYGKTQDKVVPALNLYVKYALDW